MLTRSPVIIPKNVQPLVASLIGISPLLNTQSGFQQFQYQDQTDNLHSSLIYVRAPCRCRRKARFFLRFFFLGGTIHPGYSLVKYWYALSSNMALVSLRCLPTRNRLQLMQRIPLISPLWWSWSMQSLCLNSDSCLPQTAQHPSWDRSRSLYWSSVMPYLVNKWLARLNGTPDCRICQPLRRLAFWQLW